MNNERTLSFNLSQELTCVDLDNVAAAGYWTQVGGSITHNGSADGGIQVVYDF